MPTFTTTLFGSTLSRGLLLVATLLLANITLADTTVYHCAISNGTVVQTPAEINLFSPVTAVLSGDFYVTVSDDTVQISDAMITTVPEVGFDLPTIKASFNGFDVFAPAGVTTFDNGYTGTFDGNTLRIKGSRDSRPVDGPLLEYEFTAVVVLDDATTNTGGVNSLKHAFFIARPDLRKCPSPQCGGFFVNQVNKPRTKCADGHYRAACYVARIESTTPSTLRVGQIHKNMLLEGRIAKGKRFAVRHMAIFKARKAWLPVNDAPVRKSATFAGLRNNGLMCITSPCFSYDEYKLNTGISRVISGIDLGKTGASGKTLDAAYNILGNGDVLLVAGDNKRVEDFSGIGITFVARQLYLPISKPSLNLCTLGYDYQNGQCVTPYGCIAPELEQTGYGGVAMIDPVTGEITSSITTSCVASCNPPAEITGPGRCAVYYP